MSSKIIARIERELSMPGLFEALTTRIAPTDLASLLLEVFRTRSTNTRVSEILARFEQSRLTTPSALDPRARLEVDRISFRTAATAGFEPIELSPVLPLGTVHAISGIDQNNVLAATRGVELLADPTDAWALISAQRRRDPAARASDIKLCGSQRLMRLQPLRHPSHTAHFALFGLSTAGRDRGDQRFEIDALVAHLTHYLRFFRDLGELNYRFTNVTIDLADTEVVTALLEARGLDVAEIRRTARAHDLGAADKLLGDLPLPSNLEELQRSGVPHERFARVAGEVKRQIERDFPEAHVRINASRLEGLGYYTGPMLRVTATDPTGIAIPIADGGFTNWTQRLLADRKERFLGSGIGTEVICKRYRAP